MLNILKISEAIKLYRVSIFFYQKSIDELLIYDTVTDET